jgi:hypothetical protein
VRRRTYIAVIGAAVVAGVVATAVFSGGGTQAQARPAQQPRQVVMGSAEDHLPSTTAADWVTYADHVVVVAATSEQLLPPGRSEVERGEGLLGRTVRLEVKQVLWSREGAPQPAPGSWDFQAAGAVFTDGQADRPTPMALHDRPRVEAGHQYVMAIAWEAAQCSPGDEPRPAGWVGLGEGSELPFDGGVIGQGESEGRTQSADQARRLAAEEAGPAAGIEEELAGADAAALTAKLKAATPGQRQVFFPKVAVDSCG